MNTKQVGILVNNLGPSQLSFNIINEINSSKRNITVFADNTFSACLQTNFAIMNIGEAWGITGTLIATDFSSADKLRKIMTCNRKIFYINDLEFIRHNTGLKNYDFYKQVYLDSRLELVVRSESHAKCIENAFNRKAKIVNNNFCLQEILNEDGSK